MTLSDSPCSAPGAQVSAVLIACPWVGFCGSLTPNGCYGPAVGLVFGSGAVGAGSGSGWSLFSPSSLASAAGARIRQASVTNSLSWEGAVERSFGARAGGCSSVVGSAGPSGLLRLGLEGGWGRWRWSWLQVPG